MYPSNLHSNTHIHTQATNLTNSGIQKTMSWSQALIDDPSLYVQA